MLEWYKKLYIGRQAAKKSRTVIRKVNHKKPTPGYYVLTLPHNDQNVMEIVPTTVLIQPRAYERCPLIIGLARGKDEALELMEEILLASYKATGVFRVSKYIENR